MHYVIISQRVARFADFEAVFLGGAERRKRMGSGGGKVFRSVDDPGEVIVLLQWGTAEAAREWTESFESQEAGKWATAGGSSTASVMVQVLETES